MKLVVNEKALLLLFSSLPQSLVHGGFHELPFPTGSARHPSRKPGEAAEKTPNAARVLGLPCTFYGLGRQAIHRAVQPAFCVSEIESHQAVSRLYQLPNRPRRQLSRLCCPNLRCNQVSQVRADGKVVWCGQSGEAKYIPVDVAPSVAPGVDVAAEPSAVESDVALNSFRLASSALNSAAYVEGIAKENHGGRDVSSRAA